MTAAVLRRTETSLQVDWLELASNTIFKTAFQLLHLHQQQKRNITIVSRFATLIGIGNANDRKLKTEIFPDCK